MQPLFSFLWDNREKLLEQMLEHVGLTFLSLTIAVLIAVPLGIWITRNKKMASTVLAVAGILQTIPSIALLGFLLPFLGIGLQPAIVALFLYAILPILRNTYTGIEQVSPSVIEAARGMGMTDRQLLRKVQLPLAMPVIFAGIRTATVINVGVATLAAYIGAGGLGEFIFGGIALNNGTMILAGALPAAMLAILLDQLLGWLQRHPRVTRGTLTQLGLFLLPLFSTAYLLPNTFRTSLTAAFDPEFVGRADGYPALQEAYGLDFNTLLLNSALMYNAIREKEADLIGGYSTDGRIKAFDLQVLQDDRHAFPPYFCAPLVYGPTLRAHPELDSVLRLLEGRMNDSLMTALNYQVDFEKKSPKAVARHYLKTQHLFKENRVGGGEQIVIGSKIFTEQYILAELFGMLIEGHTRLEVDIKAGLGGTKICFDALKAGEIDLYPEYTGTGFRVLMDPPPALVDSLTGQPDWVFSFVQSYFSKNYSLEWLPPLGFNNTYALMMRREDARRRGWEKISDISAQRQ